MPHPPLPPTSEQLVRQAWDTIHSNVVQLHSITQDIEHHVKEMAAVDDELEAIGCHQLLMYRDLVMNKATQGIDTDTRLKSMALSFPFYSKVMVLYSHAHSEYERLLDRAVRLVNESNQMLKENFSHASFCLVRKQHGKYLIPNVIYREKRVPDAKPQAVPSFKPPEFPAKKDEKSDDSMIDLAAPPARTPRLERDFPLHWRSDDI